MAYDLSWVTESIPIIIGKSTDMSESGSKFSISKNSIAKMKRLVKIFNITSKRQGRVKNSGRKPTCNLYRVIKSFILAGSIELELAT